ncbi:MAG TPA: ribbon-helix-helix domain-containing protein [Rhodospirillales bacterium]|jgi:predicted DNA-binding ribbon-helix-helix protein|nr:ribbon-helix-helix domain-containing protein [Rhodospirillales bacterium]|tara:strand:- start:303 stop:557 length:255 start_codon:yes stop_codon:yes gene_type:complete
MTDIPDTAPDTSLARIRKRSVTIAGHATSVSLEQAFWQQLKEIAERRGLSLNAQIAEIDQQRPAATPGNLSSAIRVFVLRNCAP